MSQSPSPGARAYFAVYLALVALVALTVEAARHDLGRWNFAVAVLIAAIKALLIALFFMHVRQSPALIKLVVCAGLLWLGILLSLTVADYWTRGWLEKGVNSTRAQQESMTGRDKTNPKRKRASAFLRPRLRFGFVCRASLTHPTSFVRGLSRE
jgi:cytochrome c oxidase subunit IV